MATNSREARRKKIMERGSDRLALITGRIQTLPSSSSSSLAPEAITHREDTNPRPSKPWSSHDQDPQTQVPDQISEFTPMIEERGFDCPKHEQVLRDTDSQVQPLLSSSTVQNASSSSGQSRLFTPSRISGAIEASESTRIYLSVAVALLVVLTHLGFPLLGSKMVKTLLGFRPLYLVLLTNVTLVLARILGGQRAPGAPERFGGLRTPTEGYEWAEVLGKSLEVGLVVKKVLDALFMDCAVYAVILVCGLSSTQKFH